MSRCREQPARSSRRDFRLKLRSRLLRSVRRADCVLSNASLRAASEPPVALLGRVPGIAAAAAWCGTCAMRCRTPNAAVLAFRIAAASPRHAGQRRRDLGIAVLRSGRVPDSPNGPDAPPAPLGRPAEALPALRRAAELSSGEPLVHAALSEALARTGAPQEARSVLDGLRDTQSAHEAYTVGRAYALVAETAGGFRASDFAAHRVELQRALQFEPSHQSARYHLIRVAIRGRDWSTAWAAATPSIDIGDKMGRSLRSRDPESTLEDFIETAYQLPSQEQQDFWLVLMWQLHSIHHLRASAGARRELAACIESDLGGRALTHPEIVRFARAQVALGKTSEALARLAAAKELTSNRHELAALDWLERDVNLASPCSDARAGGNAHVGNLRIRPLSDRRVAVVGPTETSNTDWDEILSADVVVAPKLTRSRAEFMRRNGARAIVTYLTTVSVGLIAKEARALLDDGLLDDVVVRSAPAIPLPTDRFRRASGEPSHHLEASSFAIQRIVYDLLAGSPASITIHNTDLFVTGRYDSGYQADSAVAKDRGIQRNLDGYGHDLLGDFQFLKALSNRRAVTCAPELTRTLAMTDDEYLAAVEASRSPTGQDRTERFS